MNKIYAVVNKVFCLFFEDKTDAEEYCGKVATASNGLRVETYGVIPKQGGKMTEMDEKIKEIEEFYKDEITRYDAMDVANRALDDIKYLLSYIKELEAQLHQAACDISFWREQQADTCQKTIELESQLKKGTCCNLLCQTEKLQFERRIEELVNEKSFWNCLMHGKSKNAWVCPECTKELLERVKELEEGIEKHYKDNKISCLESDGTYSTAMCRGLKKLYKLVEE
jgi:hypothetical protein